MKYLNKTLLIFVIVLFGIVLYFGFTGEWASLFIFPLVIISGYTIYFFYRQLEKEEKEREEKSVKLAREEVEAEEWMKDAFVPRVIAYSYKKRWLIIAYGFIFSSCVYFLWEYVNYGLLIAIRALANWCALFWLFILYYLTAPLFYKRLAKMLPKRVKEIKTGNWGRAYFFLFPISFLIYLVNPIFDIEFEVPSKLASFVVFFLVYTFSFLGLYAIVYINNDLQKEEMKRLEKEIKEELR